MKLQKYGVLILLAVLSLTGFGQTPQLSRGQFLEDLAVLETKLKRHHPNLFTYQTPALVDAHIANLRETTGEEVSHQEAYAKVAALCAMIQDGHLLALPPAENLVAYEQTETLLPFDVIASGKHLYLVRSYLPTEQLIAGSEILQINGVPTEELLDFLRHRLPHRVCIQVDSRHLY